MNGETKEILLKIYTKSVLTEIKNDYIFKNHSLLILDGLFTVFLYRIIFGGKNGEFWI